MAGKTDRALDLLEQAVRGGFYAYPFIAEHCNFLDPLRGTSRFDTILVLAKERMEAFAVGPLRRQLIETGSVEGLDPSCIQPTSRPSFVVP